MEKNIICEVKILWGDNVIHVAHFSKNKSFVVGETPDCDFYIPTKQVGIEKFSIITNILNENVVIVPSCANAIIKKNNQITKILNNSQDQEIALSLNESIDIYLLNFNFQISISENVDYIIPTSFDLSDVGYQALSFAAHLTLLSLCAFTYPALEDTDPGYISDEQKMLLSQYLTTMAEKELQAQQDANTSSQNNNASGAEGAAAKGSEGSLGNQTSKPLNTRYGVKGSEDNPDPHIARQRALQDAANFGMIGLLSNGTGGDPNAPTAPWGRDDSFGKDTLSANGNLFGDSIGDSFGSNGLSLSGIGEGGGSKYEGIGVGDHIGGLGYNFGKNGKAGSYDGKLKDNYKPQAIKMRVGSTSTSGKIPPEIIQRVIRQNFGKFRMCYENGLRNNPNLNGRVSVKFVISRDGSVMQAMNSGSDLPDAQVTSCITNAFRTLSFPAPESGIVTVGYSIALSPN